MFNFASALLNEKCFEESETGFSKALVIYEAKFGEESEKALNCKDALEEVRKQIYKDGKKKKCIIS
jgi:hypothetical protein